MTSSFSSDPPDDDIPEASPPEADSPRAGALQAGAPEAASRDVDAPEDDVPEGDSPDVDAPASGALQDDTPDNDAPEGDPREAHAPEDDTLAADATYGDSHDVDAPAADPPEASALAVIPLVATDTPMSERARRLLDRGRGLAVRGARVAVARIADADYVAMMRFAKRVALRHGLVALIYVLVVGVLMWPMFGPGSPPGVDSPTFLHLGWVVDQALTGNLESVFTDPYWYSGWPYAAAYPPLAYGAIGLLSAISPLPIEISFRIWTFLAFVGIGLAVYGLLLEFRVRKPVAAWGGLLALLSYPMFVSLGIFGWYSTVFALPFGIAGYAMAERSFRTVRRRDAVWAGALLAASMLSHHMTGFAFGMAMAPWAVYRLWPTRTRRRVFRQLVTLGVVFLAAILPWVVFFIPHLISVGFEREVAGNWNVDAELMIRRSLARTFLGREAYPSYIGLVHIPLAIAGLVQVVSGRMRAIGPGILLVVFTWVAFGAPPIIGIYPFSGLDVARFVVFMGPFMAVMGAVFVNAIMDDLYQLREHVNVPRWAVSAFVAVAALGLLIVPAQDGLQARWTLTPVQRIPQVDLAFTWIRENTQPEAKILAVGFRNWDDWWIPEQTGRRVMDGWNDEGAKVWRPVREVRHMGWFGSVNSLRLYNIMDELETDYLLIYHWIPLDSPQLFEASAGQDPFLFTRAASWPGVTLFERRDR